MSVKIYDDALLAKLQRWTVNAPVDVLGVADTKQLFEVISDTTNDKTIKLPLIALRRIGGYKLLNRNKQPRSFDGARVQKEQNSAVKLNQIPIGISYQIDVYTRLMEEADEYTRNLIFNIVNYPKLTIDIPYENRGIKHDANIRLISDVEDNSAIPERLVPGQFTRMTLSIEIDDAFLWDVRIKDNLSIVEIRVEHDNNKEMIYKK